MQKEPVDCEYLADGRLCRAISERPEGMDVRKEFCKNKPRDYCCYLCAQREKCEISCSFLDTPREPTPLDSDLSLKIEREIRKYEEEKTKLSSLLANGKIGERSYSVATESLDKKIKELKKAKEHPVLSQETAEAIDKPDGFEGAVSPTTRPTLLWYLVPFFFGIIGGIIGYAGTKSEDPAMADSLLVFGIIWTMILAVATYAIASSIFSHLLL